MRLIAAIAAAAVLAGFTVQDAEKAIGGAWNSPVDPVHLMVDIQSKTMTWTEAGRQRKDTFAILSAEPGLVRVTIAGRPAIIHLTGRSITIANEGEATGRYLSRPR